MTIFGFNSKLLGTRVKTLFSEGLMILAKSVNNVADSYFTHKQNISFTEINEFNEGRFCSSGRLL